MLVFGVGISFLTAVLGLFVKHKLSIFIPYASVIPLLLLSPYILYRRSRALHQRVSKQWVFRLERIGVIIILLNIPGVLVLHDMAVQYDRFLHFSAALIGISGLGLLLMPFDGIVTRKWRLLGAAGIAAFCFLFAWEGVQYTQDRVFGTHTFFDSTQSVEVDFWEDITFGALGGMFGLGYLAMSFSSFLAVRRLPQEQEDKRHAPRAG